MSHTRCNNSIGVSDGESEGIRSRALLDKWFSKPPRYDHFRYTSIYDFHKNVIF